MMGMTIPAMRTQRPIRLPRMTTRATTTDLASTQLLLRNNRVNHKRKTMTTLTISKMTVLALVAAVALLSACSKQSESAAHGADDGHGHGAGEAKAHVVTKDGVAMCTEHGVPEAQCAVCKPDLAAKLKAELGMLLDLTAAVSGHVSLHEQTQGLDAAGEIGDRRDRVGRRRRPRWNPQSRRLRRFRRSLTAGRRP